MNWIRLLCLTKEVKGLNLPSPNVHLLKKKRLLLLSVKSTCRLILFQPDFIRYVVYHRTGSRKRERRPRTVKNLLSNRPSRNQPPLFEFRRIRCATFPSSPIPSPSVSEILPAPVLYELRRRSWTRPRKSFSGSSVETTAIRTGLRQSMKFEPLNLSA